MPDGQWIEYAGGYSDMLAQRKGQADERRKAEKEKSAARAEPSGSAEPAKQKGKLSFKQKFAIENLPKQMEAKQAEIAGFEKKMADPQFFSRDPDGFSKIARQLEMARNDLGRMEEEWLELEMLREELEG